MKCRDIVLYLEFLQCTAGECGFGWRKQQYKYGDVGVRIMEIDVRHTSEFFTVSWKYKNMSIVMQL
jgi:hypothetical protein